MTNNEFMIAGKPNDQFLLQAGTTVQITEDGDWKDIICTCKYISDNIAYLFSPAKQTSWLYKLGNWNSENVNLYEQKPDEQYLVDTIKKEDK